ncbi:MAG: STAS domain-containing protein [Anaerolineae bacterium]
MEINVRVHIVRVQIIEIVGRLEAFSVGSLRQKQKELIELGEKNFVVDLRGTVFIDSAGMSTLVSLLKQSRQAGGDVVLVEPIDPAALRILTLTRFDQVFQMAQTAEGALEKF